MPDPGPTPNKVDVIEGSAGKFKFPWMTWLFNFYEWVRLDKADNYTYSVPSSLTVVAGGTPVGTVTDLQTLNDGNEYNLPEASGVPGIDLECDFTGVTSIRGLVLNARYVGSTAHEVQVRLKNYSGGDDIFMRMSSTTSNNYRTVLIPDDTNYISNGAAQVNFYHPITGVPSHDLYIDYVSILE